MCEIDWAEIRSWAQPLVTAIGIIVSMLLAIQIPRNQKKSDRLIYANVASSVFSEALARICDRLEIRFDLESYGKIGRKMRKYRADGALMTLLDLKVGELPVALIPSFSSARSGLRALNEAMNNEAIWPPDDEEIARYRVVFGYVRNQVRDFNKIAESLSVTLITQPLLLTDLHDEVALTNPQ